MYYFISFCAKITIDKKGGIMQSIRHKLRPIQFIALGYMLTILIGTLFLILPISSKDGKMTNFLDAMFIATSATCVTGLSVFDTFAHWTFFGQLIILFLINNFYKSLFLTINVRVLLHNFDFSNPMFLLKQS